MQTCQLVMGLTELEKGSVWNTMPAHTHQRRSEVYMYFNLKPESFVVHILGEPTETRHIIIQKSASSSVNKLVNAFRLRNTKLFFHLGNGRRKPGI